MRFGCKFTIQEISGGKCFKNIYLLLLVHNEDVSEMKDFSPRRFACLYLSHSTLYQEVIEQNGYL